MPAPQREWHQEVLPQGWKEAARDLAGRSVLEGFYLAGGTGLALRFGHRRSVDLDFFSEAEFSAADLAAKLRGLDGLGDIEVSPGTLHLVLRRVKVSFLHYPYPPLFLASRFETLAIADSRDIACMKLSAIASRGSRRDFVDLYVAAKAYGLGEILEWFDKKYAATPHNRVHLLKSLTYFTDAENEPMPNMLAPLDWSAVKTFFITEVPRVL
jgi:hypothetical protein